MERELNVIVKRKGDILNISSNIEKDLDYFEIEEIMAIIIELLNYAMDKITDNVLKNETLKQRTESILISNKAEEEISNFVGKLIHNMLIFKNNKDKLSTGEIWQKFDYSLSVYCQTKNNKINEVYETFHYGEVKEKEKLLSCFAFYKDIVDTLIKQNISKEDIKLMLKKSFDIMLYNISYYIDNYNTNR